MRKVKPLSLRSKTVSVSLPPSLLDHPSYYPEGLSALLHRSIAERVLGLDMEAFRATYGKPELDSRFHRDPVPQEYVRAARWILESKILGISVEVPADETPRDLQGVKVIVARVLWSATNEETEVVIKLEEGPGFRRVLYDATDYRARQGFKLWPIDLALIEDLGSPDLGSPDLGSSGFKRDLLKAWVRHSRSLRGER